MKSNLLEIGSDVYMAEEKRSKKGKRKNKDTRNIEAGTRDNGTLIQNDQVKEQESPVQNNLMKARESPVQNDQVKVQESPVQNDQVKVQESPIQNDQVKVQESPVQNDQVKVQESPVQNDQNESSKAHGKKSFLQYVDSHNVLANALGGIIAAAVCSIFTTFIVLIGLPTEIRHQGELAELQNKYVTDAIASQNKSIDEFKATFERETGYLREEIWSLNRDLTYINNSSMPKLRPTKVMSEAVSQNLAVLDDITNSNSPTGLVATTLVAYNAISLKELTVEEVADKKILLPYTEGTGDAIKEIYFYGQLSATGAWDGKCVINIYQDGKLTFIKEALYDNGKLLSGKQVFSYEFSPDVYVWAISNRTNNGDYSKGETQIFLKEYDYMQTFEMDEVSAMDIVNVDTFRAGLSPNLYAYYFGNTSDGYFNDTTGNAYMIHFMNNGAVRLLYVGNFKNGHFYDSTGNAWYIVKDEDKDTDYMYYQGVFENDKIVNLVSSLSPPLSLDDIREIIGDRTFNIELHWDKLGIA